MAIHKRKEPQFRTIELGPGKFKGPDPDLVSNGSYQLLTIKEMARVLKISSSLLYKLIQDREVPCFRVNKRAIRFCPQVHLPAILQKFEQRARLYRRSA